PVMPTAIAPAAVAPAAVAPSAIAPPGKLRLRVDRDDWLSVLGILFHGLGNRQADGLQALGNFSRLFGIATAVLGEVRGGIGRCQADRKTESTGRQQRSQCANGTTILGH